MKDNTEKTDSNKSNTLKNKENEKILSQILPEVNFSVSERDYFITVENLNGIENEIEDDIDNNGDMLDIEKGRRRPGKESENGMKYNTDYNNYKNNYTTIKNNSNGIYDENHPKTIHEKNSRNYVVKNNGIAENLQLKKLHENIHYNGIENIIVNPHSPPLFRKNQISNTSNRSVNGGYNNEFEKTGNTVSEKIQESKILEKINKNDSDNNNYINNRNTVSPVFLNSNGRNSAIKNNRLLNTPTIV